MTNFIFCLIFIQVSIFFIAAGLVAIYFVLDFRNRQFEPGRMASRGRIRPRRARRFGPASRHGNMTLEEPVLQAIE